jgi:hypothetical protein
MISTLVTDIILAFMGVIWFFKSRDEMVLYSQRSQYVELNPVKGYKAPS